MGNKTSAQSSAQEKKNYEEILKKVPFYKPKVFCLTDQVVISGAKINEEDENPPEIGSVRLMSSRDVAVLQKLNYFFANTHLQNFPYIIKKEYLSLEKFDCLAYCDEPGLTVDYFDPKQVSNVNPEHLAVQILYACETVRKAGYLPDTSKGYLLRYVPSGKIVYYIGIRESKEKKIVEDKIQVDEFISFLIPCNYLIVFNGLIEARTTKDTDHDIVRGFLGKDYLNEELLKYQRKTVEFDMVPTYAIPPEDAKYTEYFLFPTFFAESKGFAGEKESTDEFLKDVINNYARGVLKKISDNTLLPYPEKRLTSPDEIRSHFRDWINSRKDVQQKIKKELEYISKIDPKSPILAPLLEAVETQIKEVQHLNEILPKEYETVMSFQDLVESLDCSKTFADFLFAIIDLKFYPEVEKSLQDYFEEIALVKKSFGIHYGKIKDLPGTEAFRKQAYDRLADLKKQFTNPDYQKFADGLMTVLKDSLKDATVVSKEEYLKAASQKGKPECDAKWESSKKMQFFVRSLNFISSIGLATFLQRLADLDFKQHQAEVRGAQAAYEKASKERSVSFTKIDFEAPQFEFSGLPENVQNQLSQIQQDIQQASFKVQYGSVAEKFEANRQLNSLYQQRRELMSPTPLRVQPPYTGPQALYFGPQPERSLEEGYSFAEGVRSNIAAQEAANRAAGTFFARTVPLGSSDPQSLGRTLGKYLNGSNSSAVSSLIADYVETSYLLAEAETAAKLTNPEFIPGYKEEDLVKLRKRGVELENVINKKLLESEEFRKTYGVQPGVPPLRAIYGGVSDPLYYGPEMAQSQMGKVMQIVNYEANQLSSMLNQRALSSSQKADAATYVNLATDLARIQTGIPSQTGFSQEQIKEQMVALESRLPLQEREKVLAKNFIQRNADRPGYLQDIQRSQFSAETRYLQPIRYQPLNPGALRNETLGQLHQLRNEIMMNRNMGGELTPTFLENERKVYDELWARGEVSGPLTQEQTQPERLERARRILAGQAAKGSGPQPRTSAAEPQGTPVPPGRPGSELPFHGFQLNLPRMGMYDKDVLRSLPTEHVWNLLWDMIPSNPEGMRAGPEFIDPDNTSSIRQNIWGELHRRGIPLENIRVGVEKGPGVRPEQYQRPATTKPAHFYLRKFMEPVGNPFGETYGQSPAQFSYSPTSLFNLPGEELRKLWLEKVEQNPELKSMPMKGYDYPVLRGDKQLENLVDELRNRGLSEEALSDPAKYVDRWRELPKAPERPPTRQEGIFYPRQDPRTPLRQDLRGLSQPELLREWKTFTEQNPKWKMGVTRNSYYGNVYGETQLEDYLREMRTRGIPVESVFDPKTQDPVWKVEQEAEYEQEERKQRQLMGDKSKLTGGQKYAARKKAEAEAAAQKGAVKGGHRQQAKPQPQQAQDQQAKTQQAKAQQAQQAKMQAQQAQTQQANPRQTQTHPRPTIFDRQLVLPEKGLYDQQVLKKLPTEHVWNLLWDFTNQHPYLKFYTPDFHLADEYEPVANVWRELKNRGVNPHNIRVGVDKSFIGHIPEQLERPKLTNPPEAYLQDYYKPVLRPAPQPVYSPAQQSVQRPVQQPVQRPVQQPVQRPIQQPVYSPVQSPVQQPYQNLTGTSFQSPAQWPVQTSAAPPVIPPPVAPSVAPSSPSGSSYWDYFPSFGSSPSASAQTTPSNTSYWGSFTEPFPRTNFSSEAVQAGGQRVQQSWSDYWAEREALVKQNEEKWKDYASRYSKSGGYNRYPGQMRVFTDEPYHTEQPLFSSDPTRKVNYDHLPPMEVLNMWNASTTAEERKEIYLNKAIPEQIVNSTRYGTVAGLLDRMVKLGYLQSYEPLHIAVLPAMNLLPGEISEEVKLERIIQAAQKLKEKPSSRDEIQRGFSESDFQLIVRASQIPSQLKELIERRNRIIQEKTPRQSSVERSPSPQPFSIPAPEQKKSPYAVFDAN